MHRTSPNCNALLSNTHSLTHSFLSLNFSSAPPASQLGMQPNASNSADSAPQLVVDEQPTAKNTMSESRSSFDHPSSVERNLQPLLEWPLTLDTSAKPLNESPQSGEQVLRPRGGCPGRRESDKAP